MRKLFNRLDRILRGEATQPSALKEGQLDVPVGGLIIIVLLLGMVYGLCMGSYSLLKEIPSDVGVEADRYWQLLASTVKVPALFFLTLVVTFPSLYVFNALVGSRLRFVSVLRLLIASLGVNLAVLASLGPIVAFFSVTTKSYSFVLLLNVVVFAVAGVLGMVFLLQTLHRMARSLTVDLPFGTAQSSSYRTDWLPEEEGEERGEEGGEDGGEEGEEDKGGGEDGVEDNEVGEVAVVNAVAVEEEPSALDMPPGQVLGRHVRLVFGVWVCVFSLVGAQMGWVLRPFVGAPNTPFTWFRERHSNFFEAVVGAIQALLGGG